jgi:hypothetical protein
MDIKFSKDSAEGSQGAADGKGKQNVLLVVLLVLVGAFSYIYFFTGLINPLPEKKTVDAPAVSQVAKKPLPSPDGTPAKADAGAVEAKKDAAAPAAKPEAAPAAPAVAPVAAAKPKEEPKVSGEAQTSVKKPLPGVGKPDVKKPAPVEKKQPVVAEVKPAPAKEAEKKPAVEAKKPVETKKPAEVKKSAEVKKPVEKQPAAAPAVAKSAKETQKPVKKEVAVAPVAAGTGNWTVTVGNYVLEESMATDLARVRKAGLEAYVVPGPQKKTHMNRLMLAEYTDRESAQAELAKLKRLTSDAFIIDSAGMHVVYAGSYLLDSRAASEKERLAAAGFKLTVKRADVALPTKNLTAGSFADKGAAEAVLKKLRAADIKAALTRQ